MKPMLAKVFKPGHVNFPAYIQPKLNGIRGLWMKDHFLSRGRPNEEGVVWRADVLRPQYDEMRILTSRLKEPLIFDGELYCHGMPLQKINSHVAVKRVQPHENVSDIKFCIFDFVSKMPFAKRYQFLMYVQTLIHDLPHLQIVETQEVASFSEYDTFHQLFKQEGYEGSMFRDPDSPYGLTHNCGNKENRWSCLLKRKDWLEIDCELVDIVQSTEGQFVNCCGHLVVKTKEGLKFRTGTGLTVETRVVLWQRREELIKNKVKVVIAFDEYSVDGVPVRNRIEYIDL